MVSLFTVFFLLFFFSPSSFRQLCSAADVLGAARSLRDTDSLMSSNGTFKLGFFSPRNSTYRYLGIWYNKATVMDVVWVANRDKPLNDSAGVLRIAGDGNLEVTDGRNQRLWKSSASVPAAGPAASTTAKLLDTGDLVLLLTGSASNSTSSVIWQSSQNPSDTVLPNLKITVTSGDSNVKRVLRSWRSPSDPSYGRFTTGTDSFALPQLMVYDGGRVHWRSGPWNGNIFIGVQFNFYDFINAELVVATDRQGTINVVYAYPNQTLLSNYVLTYKGTLSQIWWDHVEKSWKTEWQAPSVECDVYGTCGEYGICNSLKNPICDCLEGFEPKDKSEWANGNWTGGCFRRTPLQCEGDGFLKLTAAKVPDEAEWWRGLNQDDCRGWCSKNCSCLAYAFDAGIGCMAWSKSLIDVQQFSVSGVDLYFRLAHSELDKNDRAKTVVIAVAASLGAVILVIILAFLLLRRMAGRRGKIEEGDKAVSENADGTAESKLNDTAMFGFQELVIATDNFDESNKLGQGGFGPVYRGRLEDGQEIAVKRLSQASGQGLQEFMNEVGVISKLQHRNLVRLLGCCTEGEDKMLVYEYMPNKSLDTFIFNPAKQELLSFQTRFSIIEGICRGLLYLHRDSRLRIIHRDLKASNILLDQDLNPKISDFGMARIFKGQQDLEQTRRVVGTYGYMAPEYAMEGRFSEKSDVFSFGVVLIEIITGMKNSSFHHDKESLSLLGYTWKLWNEVNIASLIDQTTLDSAFMEQVLRCLQIGLLCVQELVADRPTIAMVISMLDGEIPDLPQPKKPGFFQRQISSDTASSQESQQHPSINYVSFTQMSGR